MADIEERDRPLETIVDIADELERSHLARVPRVLQQLENLREPEDEMRQAEGMRLSKNFGSGV